MSYILYGGLFDPPHSGHLSAALEAYRTVSPRVMFWVPCAKPPHRSDTFTETNARLDMLKWWIGKKSGELGVNFEVSDEEYSPDHDGYTVTTLARFAAKYPGEKQYFLIGSDEAADLKSWHEWEKVLNNTNLLVGRRPGNLSLAPEIEEKAVLLENRMIDVSSSWIRENIGDTEAVGSCMDSCLLEYIREKGLYS